MKTFYISVTETFNRVVAVRAEDLYEAIEKVEDACNKGVVDLTADDFVDRECQDETEETKLLIADGYAKKSNYQKI